MFISSPRTGATATSKSLCIVNTILIITEIYHPSADQIMKTSISRMDLRFDSTSVTFFSWLGSVDGTPGCWNPYIILYAYLRTYCVVQRFSSVFGDYRDTIISSESSCQHETKYRLRTEYEVLYSLRAQNNHYEPKPIGFSNRNLPVDPGFISY